MFIWRWSRVRKVEKKNKEAERVNGQDKGGVNEFQSDDTR